MAAVCLIVCVMLPYSLITACYISLLNTARKTQQACGHNANTGVQIHCGAPLWLWCIVWMSQTHHFVGFGRAVDLVLHAPHLHALWRHKGVKNKNMETP